MTRILALAGAVMALAAGQASDGGRILAEMRQALGGDAAIAAVQTFSVSGSDVHSIDGRSAGSDIELLCALPDRFLRVRRMDSPFGISKEEYGFNGNERIRRRDSQMPYPPDPGENDSPAEKAQREARALTNTKREFARMAIALIGLSAVDPVDVSHAGQQLLGGTNTDVLVLRAPDGYVARVFVDASTHLPRMVSWMGTPIVTAGSSAFVTVPTGQVSARASMPSFAAMPDPFSLPPVEHQLFFEDYKTADGMTWPHRLIEKIGGRPYSTIKLGKFKLNSKIDTRRFDPRAR